MKWETVGDAVVSQNKRRQQFDHGMRTQRHSKGVRHYRFVRAIAVAVNAVRKGNSFLRSLS